MGLRVRLGEDGLRASKLWRKEDREDALKKFRDWMDELSGPNPFLLQSLDVQTATYSVNCCASDALNPKP